VSEVLAILSYSPTDTSIPSKITTTTIAAKVSSLFDKVVGALPGVNSLVGTASNVDPYTLIPVPATSLPKPDYTILLNIAFNENANKVNLAYINGSSYNNPNANDPNAPDALQLASTQPSLPTNINSIHTQIGKVYQVILNNEDNNEHPVHFHGHLSYILAHGAVNEGTFTDPSKLNYVNPVGRDTMSVNGKSYLVIQFTANNPGAWIMHCHIDWHLEAGFAIIFLEGLAPSI
jgi:iron transport multicopper oxidase